MVLTDEFYIPLVENIDKDEEIKRLTAEKVYLEGFLKSVNAKLGNEKFVQNAKPEVVQNEQKKKADTEAKLNIVNEQLSSLAN
jgi:valyl-tRNA synthetase